VNLIGHISDQKKWSRETFGPDYAVDRICDHIQKELTEIKAKPELAEWVDVILLAIDGAWRSGADPVKICEAIEEKLAVNKCRDWPDWRTADPSKAIEHIRLSEDTGEAD
jgi:hypothetical protein